MIYYNKQKLIILEIQQIYIINLSRLYGREIFLLKRLTTVSVCGIMMISKRYQISQRSFLWKKKF